MKYNEFNLGQIEAVFNKLGGKTGVKDFLADKMEVVEREFYQFGRDILNGECFINIPKDYHHDTQIDTFKKVHKLGEKEKKYYFESNLTSKNFAKATTSFVPGKTYEVVMIPLTEGNIISEDIVEFAKSKNYIFIGAQGLTLLFEEKPSIFLFNKWNLAFDEKNALWKDSCGSYGVPYLKRDLLKKCNFFKLGEFEIAWDPECILVFLRDI